MQATSKLFKIMQAKKMVVLFGLLMPFTHSFAQIGETPHPLTNATESILWFGMTLNKQIEDSHHLTLVVQNRRTEFGGAYEVFIGTLAYRYAFNDKWEVTGSYTGGDFEDLIWINSASIGVIRNFRSAFSPSVRLAFQRSWLVPYDSDVVLGGYRVRLRFQARHRLTEKIILLAQTELFPYKEDNDAFSEFRSYIGPGFVINKTLTISTFYWHRYNRSSSVILNEHAFWINASVRL